MVPLNGERVGVQGAYRTNGLPLHPCLPPCESTKRLGAEVSFFGEQERDTPQQAAELQ